MGRLACLRPWLPTQHVGYGRAMGEDDWEDFDGQTEKRTLGSWGNDLGFVDVLQVRFAEGAAEEAGGDPDDTWYEIWTGDDRVVINADSDEEALSQVGGFLLDDMTEVE
jgi:hypothetical protein